MPPRSLLVSLLLAAAVALPAGADEPLPLVFEDDFSQGIDRWEPTDPAAWTLGKDGERAVWGLNKRKSSYEPKVRSPHNVALVEGITKADQEKLALALEEILSSKEKEVLQGHSDGGYHYWGSGKTFAQIGKAFAEALLPFQK